MRPARKAQDRPDRYPIRPADLLDLATAAVVFLITVGPPLAALIMWKG